MNLIFRIDLVIKFLSFKKFKILEYSSLFLILNSETVRNDFKTCNNKKNYFHYDFLLHSYEWPIFNLNIFD